MLDKDEITKQLKKIDPELRTAFAARCSLRVLPLLVTDVEKKPFWYWKEQAVASHIVVLFAALQMSVCGRVESDLALNLILNAGSAKSAAADDTAADAEYAYASYTYAAFSIYATAFSSLSTVDATDYPTFVNDTFSATDAVIRAELALAALGASLTRGAFNFEMQADLDRMSSSSSIEKLSSEAMFGFPLWSKEPPPEWKVLNTRWKEALLALDSGFEIWIDWYDSRVQGKPLDLGKEKTWLTVPAEVREQGAKATNAYISSLNEDKLSPLNLVRAIFIGDGAVGKTSLIRRLHGEAIIEGKEEMTPGIEIKQWQLPDSEIKARFWDFGGQVMSHSMHQFFLRERCLYILLVDAGSEREKREHTTANDRAEYWLEHIKAFGNSAPVMLVGNKDDRDKVNLDMNALREKYPNVVNFYAVSCTSQAKGYLSRFDIFHDELVQQLKRVDTHRVMFTQNQFRMLTQLRERSRKQAFLDHEVFDGLCNDHEIGKVGLAQNDFLGLLDSLGEVIHFPELAWSEAYVLNPRWLTYGVYTLLYADKTESQLGLLCHADVIEILQAEKVEDELKNVLTYPKSKCRFIVDAMARFGLCYEVKTQKDKNYLVIPDRLPKDQPDLSKYYPEATNTVAFEFDFDGLLPRSLMPNLIVSRHKEIQVTAESKQLVWQRGVMLYNQTYQSKARLQVDYVQRRLLLWVWGDELKKYLSVLRDEIHQLLKPIKGLEFVENVVLPDSARISIQQELFSNFKKETAPYKRLLKEIARRQRVTSSDSGIDYDLRKVMGVIMTEKEQKQAAQNVYISNSSIGAFGGTGKNQRVSGKVIINKESKQLVSEYQNELAKLMKHIQDHEADFEIKANAYAELKQIREYLEEIETASPETQGKLRQALDNVKDGTSEAVKLGRGVMEAEETLTWLMVKAGAISGLIASSGLPI